MKISTRLLLGGLVGILLGGCSLLKNPSVTVTYPGEFFTRIDNKYGEIWKSYFFTNCEGSRTWTESDLEPKLGELKNLEVWGMKILGNDYPDHGNLTVTIDDGGKVVAEDTSEKGTNDAYARYSF